MSRATRGGVRIIGGHWRGTRIAVGAAAGLRPTPARVRETLFNWLAPDLPGARCLDLFAGTGVLGFEAASRGAGTCDVVERDAGLARALDELKARLEARTVAVHQADAFAFLRRAPQRYDVIFVDPPFGSIAVTSALEALAPGWIDARSLIYVERPIGLPSLGEPWDVIRSGRTREVHYALIRASG